MLTPPVWWFIAGVGLVILEILAPAFILVFFGLAAILVSLLTWILPTMPPWVPWIEFAFFSLAFLFGLRRWCKAVFVGKQSQVRQDLASDITGQHAVVVMRIFPGQPGKVELRGAQWGAMSDETLEPGDRVRIVKQDSITLTVARL